MNNCFSVIGDELIVGIPHYTPDGEKYFINLGNGELGELSLRLPVWISTEFVNGRIHWAGALRNGDFVLDERVDPGGYFFFVWNTDDLDFRQGSFVPGTNFWPGGEWYDTEPLRRVCFGQRDSRHIRAQPHKIEIWCLLEGQRIMVVDRKGGDNVPYLGKVCPFVVSANSF